MSMLKSFFEIGTEKSLFQGLYISEKEKLCAEYMGKYPVIFLSLKGVEGLHFADAQKMLMTIINNEVRRHYYLKTSDKLTVEDRKQFEKMLLNEDVNLVDSLRLLSQLLYLHYDQKVVILIDEYDVPLDKAFKNGYYQEMVSLIRGLFGQALKTNEFLQFAVLTGCLRVSKESIFTGLNNFEINSIVDIEHEEGFGFTDAEELQKQLNVIMSRMISVLDTKAREEQKENFYHGFLLGLLRGSNPDWLIKSNRESGDGYSDILIEPENPDAGIIIEVKYAASISGLDKACENAMAQIKNRRYDEALRGNGRCDILSYGIAFHKKRCRVVCERIDN